MQRYIVFAESLDKWHGSEILWSKHECIGPIETRSWTCFPLRQLSVAIIVCQIRFCICTEWGLALALLIVFLKFQPLVAEDSEVGLEDKDYFGSEEQRSFALSYDLIDISTSRTRTFRKTKALDPLFRSFYACEYWGEGDGFGDCETFGFSPYNAVEDKYGTDQ